MGRLPVRPVLWIAAAFLVALAAWHGCGPTAFESYAIAVGKVTVEGSNPAEPVAGAEVVLAGMRAYREAASGDGSAEPVAGTEDDGSFIIRNIPLTTLNVFLTVSRDGFRTLDSDLNLQSSGDLSLQLTPVDDELQAGTVNGRATDFVTGQPLGQIEITATVEVGGLVVDEQSAHTANDGLFQISGIPVGEVIVGATLEDYIPAREVIFVLPGQASNRFIELELAPGNLRVTLAGRVFDIESQEPITGALIGTDESTDTAVSGTDGAFELPNVLVGRRVINVARQGYDPLFVTLVVLAENDALALGMAAAIGDPPGPAFTIGGTITVADSATAADVSVVLTNQAGELVSRLTTEADGTYGFFVPAGTYTVRATRPGYTPAEATVTILPGEIRDDVDLHLVP